MEHFLRSVIRHMDEVSRIPSIAPVIPPYLKRVAAAVKQRTGKDTLLSDGYQDYVRLTEDSIWTLVSVVADSSAVASMRSMALKLLRRDILPHWAVRVGKGKLLRATLLRDGLDEVHDFHLLDLKTVMYKAEGDERVFVVDWQGQIEEVGEHSDTISAFRDRPEAESLLIVIDTGKEDHIKALADGGQFIIVR